MTIKLNKPPIVEVVCGFSFRPVSVIDPLTVGKYWATHLQKEYPKRQLHPPVVERSVLSVGEGIGPLRCWLVNEPEEYIVQIQHDRFYFNWRKRKEDSDYPRFNDYDGCKGVLSRSLAEYEKFEDFCKQELDIELSLTRVELAKIDLLEQDKHWTNFEDLAHLVPLVKEITRMTDSQEPNIQLGVTETKESHQLHFSMNHIVDSELTSAIRLEARVAMSASTKTPREQFIQMNQLVNEVFFRIVEDKDNRFEKGEG